jgi:flagellar biosynthesis/type III secretory pathway protein FliH
LKKKANSSSSAAVKATDLFDERAVMGPRGGFTAFQGAKPLVHEGADIHDFVAPVIGKDRIPTYGEFKSSFKQDLTVKDRRFQLSEHAASQLSVEAEEQKRFEAKVAEELEKRLQVIRAEAHDSAYQKGMIEGKNDGLQKESVRLAQLIESLATAYNAIAKAKDSLEEHYRDIVIEAVFGLAKIVVHHEIEARPEQVAFSVKAILDILARDDDVRVRISATDFEAIELIKKEMQNNSLHQGRIAYESDSALGPGDSIVQNMSGEITSKVEDKFEKLKAELFRKTEKQDAAKSEAS